MSFLARPPAWIFAAVAALEIGLVWYVSGRPGDELAPRLPGPSGNLLHVPAGAALCLLVLRATGPRLGWFDARAWPGGLATARTRSALGAVFLHAVVNEIHQFHVPGRACSVADLFLDTGGGLVALLVPLAGAEGRPARWMPAVLVLAATVALAWLSAGGDLPGDDLLARLLHHLLD